MPEQDKARRAMRRDAQERRNALLDAAAACFRESGYLVPLEDIAERAGVGRGTLYRNFRDRDALALAIFSREIDQLGAAIDPDASLEQTLAQLVRSGASAAALFARISSEMVLAGENVVDLKALRQRLLALLEPVARRAHQRGELRADIDASQLVIGVKMIAGLRLDFHSEDEIDAQLHEALNLLLGGLRPR